MAPSATSPSIHPLKRKRVLIPVLLGGMTLLVFIGMWIWHLFHYQETDDAYVMSHIHPISARINGSVTGVYVLENQNVKAGQLLVTLDSSDYDVKVASAEAALSSAKAQAETAKQQIPLAGRQNEALVSQSSSGVFSSQANVSASQASVDNARAAVILMTQRVAQQEAILQKASADKERYHAVDPRAISKSQLDAVDSTYDANLANRNAAQAELLQSQARLKESLRQVNNAKGQLGQSTGRLKDAKAQQLLVDIRKSDYETALAAVKQAEAQLKQAKLDQKYTRIYAPVSGRIGKKTAEIGQRLQIGQPMMAVVEPGVWVAANFKETQVGAIKPGQHVELDVDAFPHHEFEGVVDSISPASGAQFALLPPDNATGNFTKIVQRIPIKIYFTKNSIKGYEKRLTPGMSTVVKIRVSE